MHIVSMQSNAAAITLFGPGSGVICQRISGHIRFRSDFQKIESGTSLVESVDKNSTTVGGVEKTRKQVERKLYNEI